MKNIFTDSNGRLHRLWRLPLFAISLLVVLSPLFLVSPQWLQLALAVILLTVFLKLWAAKIEQKTPGDYGISGGTSFGIEFLFGLAVGGLVIGLIFAASVSWSTPDPIVINMTAIDGAFWMFLFRMLLVAYWEELIFRGFLLTSFRDYFATKMSGKSSMAIAVLLSSLLFALVHGATDNFPWAAFSILTLNGAIWCLPVILTSRLGMSIGLHAAWNFAQTKIFGFSMSGNQSASSLFSAELTGPDYWTGGAYGPEAGLSGIVALVVTGILVLACHRAFLRRRNDS
ncbi:MAG: type II CAAX endopeptidase family protein [Pseudomonadota bacterium]